MADMVAYRTSFWSKLPSLFWHLAQKSNACYDSQHRALNSEQEFLNVWRHQEAIACTATGTRA